MNPELEQKFDKLDNQIVDAADVKAWQKLFRNLTKIKRIATNKPADALSMLDQLGRSIINKIDQKHWKTLEASINDLKETIESIQNIAEETSETAKNTVEN